MKQIIVIMGISGAGKSTVSEALSKNLHLPYLDADDFHSKANLMKMSSGTPLTDDDRWPWLASIVEHILNAHRSEFILACSALKQSYRDYLSQRLAITWVFLEVTEFEATARLANRKQHYMHASLIQSQLATLEIPKNAIKINATDKLSSIVSRIELQLKKDSGHFHQN
ncbi:gluconate kinase (SKI family) [Roseivirga ehrenbergii]|uniref:gluconokinase n=1 Tax=Roseivirga ehrenbergii (strain DSM 102268 / JCM 13514 / KCTC 12282 / NCIMB 14502 / KMM 6017) TaxID=279360 RepID=UPI0009FD5EAB|nr:gluconokinase [Roseivirga ehrenbergii]TCL14196.1 gluconate kinase (SKI family) [Roseivirga ehrenbergii]